MQPLYISANVPPEPHHATTKHFHLGCLLFWCKALICPHWYHFRIIWANWCQIDPTCLFLCWSQTDWRFNLKTVHKISQFFVSSRLSSCWEVEGKGCLGRWNLPFPLSAFLFPNFTKTINFWGGCWCDVFDEHVLTIDPISPFWQMCLNFTFFCKHPKKLQNMTIGCLGWGMK